MKKKIFYGLGIILILFIIIANIDNDTPKKDEVIENYVNPVSTAKLSSEWNEPVALGLNSKLWEDGVYITGDGKTLYYVIYPGEDLVHDVINNDFKGDIDIYYSEYPFTEGKKHELSEKPWSEGGVMISGDDTYYMSNKPVDKKDKTYDDNIYKNDKLLDFNTDYSEGDPHYCNIKDELYFWYEKTIYVYKNDKVEKLLSPINNGEENIQPFLTPDCQTMYFTSKRNSDKVLKIYKSKRLDDDNWDEPLVVIESNGSVGEPTLTDDGKKIFFVQIFYNEGKFSSDLYYAEKK